MKININRCRERLGTTLAALAIALCSVAVAAAPAAAQTERPRETINLSQNTGTLIRLSSPMSDVFIANAVIADVQVRSPTQLYVFGKSAGETTIYATDVSGQVVYSTSVRVGANIGSVDEMLRLAMPEASIQSTPINNLVLLTGTVGSPEDVEEAQRLVQAYVGETTQIVNRLRSATPLQVNLRVRIAEVNRSLMKSIGVNLLSKGGSNFGISQGQGIFLPQPGEDGTGAGTVIRSPIGSTLSLGGKFLGLDLLATLDLAESDGLVTTLAEPNLTALSGETASFLAGGEFPIPVPQDQGTVTITYKQYGVGLSFTPIVLAGGRISMRVRPEVSELSTEGSLRLNGFNVPAITTRRAETTVELGSGQSFMIAGLLRNANTKTIDKAPFLGDLPILGALFRSTSYRRSETELVIIVTPYLVRPVSSQLPLPTDGYRAPSTGQIMIGGQSYTRRSVSDASSSTDVRPSGSPLVSTKATKVTKAARTGRRVASSSPVIGSRGKMVTASPIVGSSGSAILAPTIARPSGKLVSTLPADDPKRSLLAAPTVARPRGKLIWSLPEPGSPGSPLVAPPVSHQSGKAVSTLPVVGSNGRVTSSSPVLAPAVARRGGKVGSGFPVGRFEQLATRRPTVSSPGGKATSGSAVAAPAAAPATARQGIKL